MTPNVSSRRVISAIYDLHARDGQWPTLANISDYLDSSEAVVRGHLRSLKEQRLHTDRQRNGERVWMPWREA